MPDDILTELDQEYLAPDDQADLEAVEEYEEDNQ